VTKRPSSFGVVLPGAHHLLEFGAVRRDDRSAGIAGVIGALRVDQNGFARIAREGDHARDVREPALAVVGKEHRVVFWRELREGFVLHGQRLMVGLVLEVHSQQLLVPADDAQLDGGLEARIAFQVRRDAGFPQQHFQAVAGLVVADHAEETRLRAQRCDVVRDVGSGADALFFARDPDDRDRRFGRDAFDRAVPVAVEHRVADDQHAGLGNLLLACDVHNSSTRRAG
jgi:hypothetical protein